MDPKSSVQKIKFKVLIIGTSGVGKSSLLLKFVKNTFSYDYQVTTGVQFFSKPVKINQKTTANLQIWDTMGQEAFRSVVRSLYKGVSAILLTYSIDNKQSFNHLEDWFRQITQSVHKQTIIWLVGTKLDLDDIRKVTKIEGQAYSKSISAGGFTEVSAKTGQNIKELFDKLAKVLCKKFITSQTFRELVQPTFESGVSKGQSFSLTNYRMSARESKECC